MIALPKIRQFAVAVLVFCAFAASSAAAQNNPAAPIRIVVRFAPGSTADTMARLVGKYMETTLGQPVVVESRPGNSSMLAADMVSRADKDGYTLFMAAVAQTLNPAQTGSPFDLVKNMEPIALLDVVPNVLVAHPLIVVNNLKELIELVKKDPDSLIFGTSGNGTASHIATKLFNQKAGTKILVVHYQGGAAQGLTDLLTGRITLLFNVAALLAQQVRDGKLKAIAVGQPMGTAVMPDVVTMEEAGMPASTSASG